MTTVSYPDNPDVSVGLGTQDREPASRSGHFAAGVMSHAVTADSLGAAQQRYNDVLPTHYMQHGVAQLTQNSRSALSLGLAPGDPRSGVFRGQRYLLTANNGRSASTSEAQPIFQEDV